MERYVTTMYRLNDLNCNEQYCEFNRINMYSLNVCRMSIFRERAWIVLCRGITYAQVVQTFCEIHSVAFPVNRILMQLVSIWVQFQF